VTASEQPSFRQIEDRVLLGLVAFHFESGLKSENYRDPKTGGIFEHKLAHRLGFVLAPGDRCPSEMLEACRSLEARNFVLRIVRNADMGEFGIWPTLQGIERVEYLSAPPLKKVILALRSQWTEILTSAITILVVLCVSWLLGLFGLRA